MSTREVARSDGPVVPEPADDEPVDDDRARPGGRRVGPGGSRSGRGGRRENRAGTGRSRHRSRAPLRARLRRDWPLLVMVLPAALLLLVFHYLPTLGNVVAFLDYNPYAGDSPLRAFLASPWIGLGNFEALFGDPAFWDAFWNTLSITGFQLVFYFPLPIVLAIMLNSILSARLRAFVQSVVYLPHFFSWVLVVTFFVQMLGGAGLLSQTLRDAGFEPWDVMSNPDTFIVLVTAETVWKDVGWGTIVFLAALSTIDPHLYEASAVDGAGRWRRLWHVTLPGLRSVIMLLLILRLGDALSVGFEQFLLQRDAVGRQAAEVLDTFVYHQGITTGNYGYGAAAGLFKAMVGLVLILAANRFAHAIGERGVYSRS
ncbi:ABC transporter permease [Plantactinospora sonchi]|uniref:ABC transporter permease subunit n=2 Tax=Plantactinospora sonchi TaxID=1544735 RepID=A0ABU7RWM0_9ACTN